MLKVKDKYDYRREFCDALRSGKYVQILGSDPGEHPNEACAIRVFAIINDMWGEAGANGTWCPDALPYSRFGKLTGISPIQVYARNDGDPLGLRGVVRRKSQSFAEIADWIERQP